jgi:hypothetical protein
MRNASSRNRYSFEGIASLRDVLELRRKFSLGALAALKNPVTIGFWAVLNQDMIWRSRSCKTTKPIFYRRKR